MAGNPLEQGLQVVHRAVEYDHQQNFVEAVKHYNIAISYFQEAARAETAPDRAQVLHSKIHEYQQRVQALEAQVAALRPQPVMSPSSIYVQPPAGYGVPAPAPSPALTGLNFSAPPAASPVPFPTPLPLSSPSPLAPGAADFTSSSFLTASSPSFGSAAAASSSPGLIAGGLGGGTPAGSGVAGGSFIGAAGGGPPVMLPPTVSVVQTVNEAGQVTTTASTHRVVMSGGQLPAPGPETIIVHPMIAEYAMRFPKDKPNLQAALDLAEMAKVEDKANNMQAALDLYVEVLERFLSCYNAEASGRVRDSLRETISSYMLRAEKIKEAFKITPTPCPVFSSATAPLPPPIPSSSSYSSSSSSSSFLMGGAGGGGIPSASPPPHPHAHLPSKGTGGGAEGTPSDFTTSKSRAMSQPGPGVSLTVSNQTKSIFGRKSLHFTATLVNSQVSAGAKAVLRVEVINESTLVVEYIKVSLRSNTRKATTDAKGKSVMERTKEIVRREEFYQGSIFPLQAESNYKGDLHFLIPPGLPGTNLQHAGFFERDYELKLECILPLRANLAVYLPILID